MFRWYQRAAECFAYLVDVPPAKNRMKKSRTLGRSPLAPPEDDRMEQFCRSEWFTRGWTLQELLAPAQVIFCDATWKVFGSKQGLSKIIQKITGINEKYLRKDDLHATRISDANVATKMSWMSGRCTSREEDMAYCMLGLFNVSMPLLYGERDKAFMRLQMEIIRISNDQSIFAWGLDTVLRYDLLATRPEFFKLNGLWGYGDPEFTYAASQRGIELHVPRCLWIQHPEELVEGGARPETCELILDCRVHFNENTCVPCIVLKRYEDEEPNGRRVRCWERQKLVLRLERDVQERRLSLDDSSITTIIAENLWSP